MFLPLSPCLENSFNYIYIPGGCKQEILFFLRIEMIDRYFGLDTVEEIIEAMVRYLCLYFIQLDRFGLRI